MRIGIMTYHGACNYGAYLQACALCSRLNQEDDIDAEIIDFTMKKERIYYSSDSWSIKRKLNHFKEYKFTMDVYKNFERCDHRLGLSKKSQASLISDSLDDFVSFVRGKYDVIVAGSDEIWNIRSFRGFPSPYWLPGDLGARKFSYAASARIDFSKEDEVTRQMVAEILSDFEFIGVRDRATFDGLNSVCPEGKMAMCCDPSFLYDFDISKLPRINLSNYSEYDSSKKTILLMTENGDMANQLHKVCDSKYNLVSVYHWHSGYINVSRLTPEEWLSIIKDADLIIASYFHAVCFSIVQHKSFLALQTESKSIKMTDLLVGTPLENRFMRSSEGIDLDMVEKTINEKIDSNEFDSFIQEQREGFVIFLDKLRRTE